MGIKSCLNLLIVSVVLGQGIAVPLEENKEASSALNLRQKRSSPPSGDIPGQSSPESSLSLSLKRLLQISPERRLRSSTQNINREPSAALSPRTKGASSSSEISRPGTSGHGISGHEISRREPMGFPQPPRSRVGLEPPAPWKGPLPLGMVRIYHGEKEIGLGFVAVPTCFVAKAHLFTSVYRPREKETEYLNGEYHIEYTDQNGENVRRNINRVKRNRLYIKNQEAPWGPNDVCMVENDAGPQKSPDFSNLLEDSRLFTSDQMYWIHSRTGAV